MVVVDLLDVKSEENCLGWYFKDNIEPLLVAARTSRTITHEEIVDPKAFKKTKGEQRKNEWTARGMRGKFARDMKDKDKNNTWRWMIKSAFKGCTKVVICIVPRNSLYGLTISSTMLAKLPRHPFVGCWYKK